MSDQTIRVIADLIGFIGFGGFLAILGWVWRLSRQITNVENQATDGLKRAQDAFTLAVQVKDDLNAFKVESIKRFVTDEALERSEERTIGAINRLAERLDRIIERLPVAAPRGQARP